VLQVGRTSVASCGTNHSSLITDNAQRRDYFLHEIVTTTGEYVCSWVLKNICLGAFFYLEGL
jgi:hypothetical protein